MKQQPVRLQSAAKRDVRTLFGALCWRERKGSLQFALVTSRRSGRWVLPKGWPVDGATPSEAAAAEAYEEAGLTGKTGTDCIGIYSYTKDLDRGRGLPCVVAVFPMRTKTILSDWPEAKERRRKWFGPKKAAALVDSPKLSRIIKDFDPAQLSR